MPVRNGRSNGAITKSYRPSESQRIARTTARKVIDLTQESSEEEAGPASKAGSVQESEEEQDSEEEPESEEQEESEEELYFGEQDELEENLDLEEQLLDFGGQLLDLEEQEGFEESEDWFERPAIEGLQDHLATQVTPGISYAVTGYHHRPWSAGDDFHMVGVFNTEREAKCAALDDYKETCESMADGWEYYWQGGPGDKKITLVAKVEDYEVQQETYRGTINRVHHQEKPSLPSTRRGEPRVVQGQAESSHVYVVKEERRLSNQLMSFRVHNIYREEIAANNAAQELCEIHLPFQRDATTVKHRTRQGLVSILLKDRHDHMEYWISVEKRQLL